MSTNIAKAGIGYTVANILIKGINFLTLPIFSRVLGTYDFGIYNVFIAYDAILYIVISLALHSSVRSANWEFPGKIDSYVSSISIIYVLNMLVLIALALLFGPQISSLIDLSVAVIICLILHSIGASIITLYNERISLNYSYKKYMLVASATSIGNVALSLVLIFTLCHAEPYMGRILGLTIVFALAGAIILVYFWKRAKPKINLLYWKFGIKYSTPIVFHGLSQVVLNQMGRLMINYMITTAAAGIYGLATSLQLIIVTVVDSISTVWFTWYFESIEGETADNASGKKATSQHEIDARRKKIRSCANVLMVLFALLTIVVLALTPELIWILGGDTYAEGAYCAFGMVLSGFCIFIYNLVVVSEYHQKKTHYIMISTIIAALVNIVLNYIFISLFGYIAAAYATLIAYVVYALIHWVVSRRLAGFSIVSLNTTLMTVALLGFSTAVCLFFIDMTMLRILINVAFCGILLFVFQKKMNGIQGLRAILKGSE